MANNLKHNITILQGQKQYSIKKYNWRIVGSNIFFIFPCIEEFAFFENSDCPSILHKINRYLWKSIIEHTPEKKNNSNLNIKEVPTKKILSNKDKKDQWRLQYFFQYNARNSIQTNDPPCKSVDRFLHGILKQNQILQSSNKTKTYEAITNVL